MYASSRLIKIRLNKVMPADSLEWHLRSISINGSSRGCSGFVKYKLNGIIVYINTDISMQGRGTILYRVAKDFKDFTGGINNYTDEEHFAEDIKRVLIGERKDLLVYLQR